MKTMALILAGGQGSRLGVLSYKRAKPAVVFAGGYRIIDFTLSNVVHSGIERVGIPTQYKPLSLMDHVGKGKPWGFVGKKRTCRILPPYTGIKDTDWYLGTADAVFQNISFIRKYSPDYIFVLSGDHIYHMDYSLMLKHHIEKGADLTIAVQEVPMDEAQRFGIAVTNSDQQIVEFQEKPKVPKNNMASLGIYVFSKDILLKRLIEDAHDPYSEHDFGNNIIPRMISEDKVFAYPFSGFWKDVGTLHSYWETHMELLEDQPKADLWKWNVITNPYDRCVGEKFPATFHKGSHVENSIVGAGCIVEGTVINSVLSPGVRVEPGAVIENSIIMNDSRICAGTQMNKVISDKDIVVGKECRIGYGENIPNRKYPNLLSSGLTVIGKTSEIPAKTEIGANCLVFPDVSENCFSSRKNVASGETIYSQIHNDWEK